MRRIIKFLTGEVGRIVTGGVLFSAALIFERLLPVEPLLWILYIAALAVCGSGVYIGSVKGIMRGDLLDEKFLMSIASVGAMLVGERSEGVAVMLFFIVGELFEHRAVASSRKKIRALMDICPDEATVITESGEERVDAEDVSAGDILLIRPGERVPVDCEVIEGCSEVDTSAITGESMPRRAERGAELESGVIIINGVLRCRALRAAEQSCAMRILEMVELANERKSREESFITVFSRFYTPIVVGLALLLALVPPLFKITTFENSIYRALIFLVISCPCALVISVPMAFFGGIGGAASRGILFKGGNSFSPVSRVKLAAFDKTGTLTTGDFSVKGVRDAAIPEAELLSLAASVECGSNHPIAKSICKSAASFVAAEGIKELSGMGTTGTVSNYRISVGNIRLMEYVGATVPEFYKMTTDAYILCAKDSEFIGGILIEDEVRDGAREALDSMRRAGIERFIMLSGDRRERAEKIAFDVGIDEVFAPLLPEGKFDKLEQIITEVDGTVMFVGDGINDAPSLARADVGVAMGGIGSDSAIESADLVITSDNLAKIPEAVMIARRTLLIAKENIAFAIGIKLLILVLGALGFANMWLAVFADVGVAVIAILNSMRTLLTKKMRRSIK